jgi:acyl-CoA thioesterase
MSERVNAQEVAEMVAVALYHRDQAARSLGITLSEIRPGYARMTMTVRLDMLNSHDICHGGFSYTLADTAFAYACNSRNQVTVSAGCSVVYPASSRLGDVLTAVAEERFLRGRTGIYDIAVTNQNDELVVLLRGQSRRIEGKVVTAL